MCLLVKNQVNSVVYRVDQVSPTRRYDQPFVNHPAGPSPDIIDNQHTGKEIKNYEDGSPVAMDDVVHGQSFVDTNNDCVFFNREMHKETDGYICSLEAELAARQRELEIQELGGNAWWFDRFLSQHIAIFYYFMTAFMYTLSPRMAYHFSECVENHAFETYDKFIKAKGDEMKKLPPSKVALKYYTEGDMYLFDEFQTSRAPNTRRPIIDNLYDVFVNIRDDEAEHCKTMKACQTPGNLRSPHSGFDNAFEDDVGCILPDTSCEGYSHPNIPFSDY